MNLDNRPLIIQSDRTLLLEVHSSVAEECRADISAFAELIRSPEHIHTFSISPLSLWNAASAGLTTQEIITRLNKWSKFDVPEQVIIFIEDFAGRFGKIILTEENPFSYKEAESNPEIYYLYTQDEKIYLELQASRKTQGLLYPTQEPGLFTLDKFQRGNVKLVLIGMNYPIDDRIPLKKGTPIKIEKREKTVSGRDFIIRDYQKQASEALLGDLGPGMGYGTLVLPCGAGKTIVGIEILSKLSTRTLILCPNIVAVHQWKNELLDKTFLTEEQIGEYSGEKKEIKDITICTYQVLTYRKSKTSPFIHMNKITKENWGLVVYDEVHMLPAPVFKVTSELQSSFRVGLTATLIREDGRENDVFCLVGPKRFDVPWNILTNQGWIAQAYCYELRVPLPDDLALEYAIAENRQKSSIASTNPTKIKVIKDLLQKHNGANILIIGKYLKQLKQIKEEFGFPLITGSLQNAKRDLLYQEFRSGKQKVLIVSNVANFAIDLPDASVAIQVSGSFGSRQEEAQRLGRILRPKDGPSYFYTLISKFTIEENYGANRQKFLIEQGYRYSTRDA